MPEIAAVTVYAASAKLSPERYLSVARVLGRGIAQRGWTLVYGGATIGLMGASADAALEAGGRVEGVILDTFSRVAHHGIHQLETVGDMRSRKAGLARLGDAYVALPGGYGTLEELSEVLVERQLSMHTRPVLLVNVDGFWDGLLGLIDRQIADGLVKPEYRELFSVVASADAALQELDAYAAAPAPVASDPAAKIQE